MSGTAAVVGEVLGLVLHNDGCIRSTPLHKKEEELLRSNGSLKREGGCRRDDVERQRRWTNIGDDRSSSCTWSEGSARAYL
jgi:hypothetical protein